MADILKFPPTFGQIFRDFDKDRTIKGNVTRDEARFSAYFEVLGIISKYSEATEKKIVLSADNPHHHLRTHMILINFGTSEFEGKAVRMLSDIIRPFDNVEIFLDDEDSVRATFLMDGMYAPKGK